MIRQISAPSWRALVASKGSQQEQDAFLRDVNAYREDWASRKQALTNAYKGNLQDPAYLAAKAALQAEAESRLLAYGFYEETTPEQDEAEEEDNLSDIIGSMPPARILKIVTRITNYFRSKQVPPKKALTIDQVRARLLA